MDWVKPDIPLSDWIFIFIIVFLASEKSHQQSTMQVSHSVQFLLSVNSRPFPPLVYPWTLNTEPNSSRRGVIATLEGMAARVQAGRVLPLWLPLLEQARHRKSETPATVRLSTPMGSHFEVGAPPIVEPVLVGIGMFTRGTGFDPQPYGGVSCFRGPLRNGEHQAY